MQTPIKKQTQDLPDNQHCKTPLISGTNLKKITVYEDSRHRQPAQIINYAPMRNIMPIASRKQETSNQQITELQVAKLREENQKLWSNVQIERQQLLKKLDQAIPYRTIQILAEQQRAKQQLRLIISKKFSFQQKANRNQQQDHRRIKKLIQAIAQKQSQLYQRTNRIQTLVNQTVQITRNRNSVQEAIQNQTQILYKRQNQVLQIEQRIQKHNKQYQGYMSKVQIKKQQRSQNNLSNAILKMQINPLFKVRFNTYLLNAQDIFDRKAFRWERKNQKILSDDQIRFFILIQLYPHWRRILNRLSHNFEGYKQILFLNNKNSQNQVLEIKDYIECNKYNGRAIASNKKITVALFSALDQKQDELIALIKSLSGQTNGIIDIGNVIVQRIQNSNVQEITIDYVYKNQKLFKKIEFIRIKELTREVVSDMLSKNGKKSTLLCVYIPALMFQSTEKSLYEGIFNLIRKEK